MTLSKIEEEAKKATALPSFAINFDEVRRSIEQALTQIGRWGFYDEYTPHDFGHVSEALAIADWLVTPTSRKLMSQGDWFMLVMATYLHDLGLLVTREEFENRQTSQFRDFCEHQLFKGPKGKDYQAKVDQLPGEQRERFLYQEFVRYHHGDRVKAWIEGKSKPQLGAAQAIADTLDSLLSGLSNDVRRDLALLCDSHTKDNLDDTSIYKLRQAYGNSDAEEVNLQYCAAVLRSADLLHITKSRAPTILFRLINPVDPVSQKEWAKQGGVRRIRPKPGLDKNDNISADAFTDTIEVLARFSSEDGFFGLTSYLRYAESQLQQTHAAIENAKKHSPKKFEFPWRHIDDLEVEADGFIKNPFGFELDQAKILELLTGHTLYNDTSVVLRELVQNSLDAVRLQANIEQTDAREKGHVRIDWVSDRATLEVADNGTGMTQEIIERHLLKVGSSRYQDSKFREDYPTFSPISRFGIGVLSAFMVADEVEVLTIADDDQPARQISLRSVHGKYLIRLLDRNDPEVGKAVGAHGTRIRLKMRASAKRPNVLNTVQKWILFPGCQVSVSVDGAAPVRVGYSSPGDAVAAILKSPDYQPFFQGRETKVVEVSAPGVTLAFAISLNRLFGDWSYVTLPERTNRQRARDAFPVTTCTCVQGIAVTFETPGFVGQGLLAIANTSGEAAPRTNVARSAIEDTAEQRAASRKLYDLYLSHALNELGHMQSERGRSLTWAVEQIPFIASPLLRNRERARPLYPQTFAEVLQQAPFFLSDEPSGRATRSLASLRGEAGFWTVQSLMLDSLERLIRESKKELTISNLWNELVADGVPLPDATIVANLDDLDSIDGLNAVAIAELTAHEEQRRLDVKYVVTDDAKATWLSTDDVGYELVSNYGLRLNNEALRRYDARGRHRHEGCLMPVVPVSARGLEEFIGANISRNVFLIYDTPVAEQLRESLARQDQEGYVQLYAYLWTLSSLLSQSSIDANAISWDYLQNAWRTENPVEVDFSPLRDAAVKCGKRFRIYDPFAWAGRGVVE